MNIIPEALFAALANPVRLRCLVLLQTEGELCVCELTYAVGAPQPSISRHLAQLRQAGIVQDRREGLWIHYRLHPSLPEWVKEVLDATAQGVVESEPFNSDRNALAMMPDRPQHCCAA